MKQQYTNLFLTLSLFFAITLFSCQEEEPPVNSGSVAGTWNMSGLEYGGTTSAGGVSVSYTGLGSAFTFVLDFR